MAEELMGMPETVDELIGKVRELREAQRKVLWAKDKDRRRILMDRAVQLGRRMDMMLDLMQAYADQTRRPLVLRPLHPTRKRSTTTTPSDGAGGSTSSKPVSSSPSSVGS